MLCQSPFNRLDSSQDCKKLYQFLDFCQHRAIEENQAKIASIALEIPPLDPLTVLCNLAQPDQLHFYFEHRDQQQSVAALDAVLTFELSGPQRFAEAQKIIEQRFGQLLTNQPKGAAFQPPFSSPCFFCSFTFFEDDHSPISPFRSSLCLPRWQISRWNDHSLAIVNLIIDSQSRIGELTQHIWNQLQTLHLAQYDVLYLCSDRVKRLNGWEMSNPLQFRAAVASVLQSIQAGQFDKLVLAHAVDVCSSVPFQWGRSLHYLRQLHPDCCVFSIGNGKGQSFIGASPERLLQVRGHKLITDALAGSACRGRTVDEDTDLAQCLLNSDKERREHQLVVAFIVEQLRQLGLQPQFADAPGLLPLSNIQHLHTPIQAQLPRHLHALDILAALHPTPAVAGLPRSVACEQIRCYEPFGRSLYAAPLGWVDAQGNAEFIVGIRSALLDGDRARLYAGAGIVAGSDPDRELAEIQLKLQALLRALV
ncbi:MAG: isochorismate synthase [Synechococcales cyanobacterium M58_A2018_015]|nr:isochorismate synthase [Synechococcales cyanobacterium M58_A2018_015]